MNQNTHDSASREPIGTKTLLVHKDDCEGALIIDALTGVITQPINERPEWAEGLAVALLAERTGWYAKRLGPDYAKTHAAPDVLNFADLGWLGVDAEGSPVELDAAAEHRMAMIAEHLGVHRDADLSHGKHDNTTGELAHVVLDMDTHAALTSEEDAKAFDKAIQDGFPEADSKMVNK
ncbi:hypothetical protein M2322_002650 [Rhodoblastus acidophilus]|uniref:hypothetical protein n=1 Tax=Rhodoblastus acidophilus TaxID=1074 RepID=UPI002224DBAF|nr:hypothetical protein [Rhodoblastus acidophilus]MCW2317096.1 hypothetical protein [Rhodoblastus acidophilus]